MCFVLAGTTALLIFCTMVVCCPKRVLLNACLYVAQETSSFDVLPCILRVLYGDSVFLPFRKMKNHQVRTEKQRMLHRTMAKVRPPSYHLCHTCSFYFSLLAGLELREVLALRCLWKNSCWCLRRCPHHHSEYQVTSAGFQRASGKCETMCIP